MGISSTSDSTTSYSNAAYSSNGVSGLVSGIDTDSVVESMLSNIQSKIDKQNQAKQQLEWKQEIYRSVITDINDFQSKYFNLTSSSCIRLESFFNSAQVSSTSSAVSVSAKSNAIDSSFSMQVARLATSTSVTSSKVGTGKIETSSAKADNFEYDRSIKIKLDSGDEFSVDLKGVTGDDVCERINNAAGRDIVSYTDSVSCTDADGNALKQKLFTAGGDEYTGNVKIETTTTYKDEDGNTLTYNKDEGKYYSADDTEYTGTVISDTKASYTDENGNALEVRYYNADDTEYTGDVKTSANVARTFVFSGSEGFEISGSTAGMAILGLSGTVKAAAAKDEDGNEIADKFELKTSGFNENFAKTGNVNGTVDITLDGVKKSFSIAEGESMADLAGKVQKAFGTTVQFTEGANGWEISVQGTGRQLSVSANADTLEAIGFSKGTTVLSNQLLRTDTVGKLGVGDPDDTDATYSFNLNGVDIEYKSTDSIYSIMNKINTSSAGVNITYDDLSDKFKMTSTSTGEGYGITLTGDDEGLFEKLGFSIDGSGSLDQSSVTAGKNAVVNINGSTFERATNDFTYNGMSITLKSTTGSYALNADGTFAENSDGTIKVADGAVENKAEVSTSRDIDKIVDTLKSFVEDYNQLIEKLNGYIHEDASYKDYAPLTDAQKKEMTEKEIELWEEKSKEGLLRNDKDISSFLSEMRTAMYTKGDSSLILSSIGINSSSQWSDYGKLSIDEDQLRNALQTNADEVKKLFVGENGLATRLNTACTKAANTSSASPGALVTIAGVKGKATETDNNIKDQLDAIAEKLESLNRIYESRKERYWNQFNAMEEALSKMNSQSDYFAQYLG
ncbi:MAG: flagellar filament capping protein FliD [Porcipelethomonas sp.]